MTLDEIKVQCARLSPWAHVATVGSDNQPDVSPVHPCWEADTLWVMCFNGSVKVQNVRVNPNVAFHWQVDASGDGVELWGLATIVDDLETKRRMWNGVFDYDLSAFAPGGPDNSPDTVFMAVQPTRAVYLKMYGANGSHRWSA